MVLVYTLGLELVDWMKIWEINRQKSSLIHSVKGSIENFPDVGSIHSGILLPEMVTKLK